jgi:hypothetical protein
MICTTFKFAVEGRSCGTSSTGRAASALAIHRHLRSGSTHVNISVFTALLSYLDLAQSLFRGESDDRLESESRAIFGSALCLHKHGSTQPKQIALFRYTLSEPSKSTRGHCAMCRKVCPSRPEVKGVDGSRCRRAVLGVGPAQEMRSDIARQLRR